MVGQVPALLGIEKPSGDFFEKPWGILTHLGDTEWLAALVGGVALVVIMVLKRYLPVAPAALVAVLGGIAAVAVFHLDEHGLDVVGSIKPSLPPVGIPGLDVQDLLDLVGPAVGVLLIGFAEGLGAAKTYATRDGYDIDSNAELLGLGAANLGAGLCSGMVVNGSLSKTAVNGGAGARSQLSGITVAVLTVVTLLFMTGLFEQLPECVLAAVVIAAVVELVDIASLRRLYGVWTGPLGRIYHHAARVDFIAAVATMLGVLVFDTLPGLFIGVAISLLTLLYRSSRPHVARLVRRPGPPAWVDLDRHPELVADDQVVVSRVEAGIYFANADAVRDAVRASLRPDTRAVVLDVETVPTIDVSGASMLATLHSELQGQGIRLLIARSVGQVRDVISTAEPAVAVPARYESVDEAVAAAQRLIAERTDSHGQ